jgi:hypothetical protein
LKLHWLKLGSALQVLQQEPPVQALLLKEPMAALLQLEQIALAQTALALRLRFELRPCDVQVFRFEPKTQLRFCH